jgi:hypothetical protein
VSWGKSGRGGLMQINFLAERAQATQAGLMFGK